MRAAEPETGAWSNAIVVPGAAETGKEEKQQEKEEKKKEREEEKEKPKEEPEEERGPITFSPGINAGPEKAFDVPGATTLGAKTARISVEYNEVSGSFIAEEASWYVNKGTTPLILFDFTGKMPSAAQAKGITALARIPGLKLIEFGNETNYNYQYKDEPSQASYKARARTYAERFVEAAQALKPFGIGLLAQGSPGSTKSSVWLNEMFAAEPELTKYVSGWTVHPYGTKGPSEMEETVADLAAHGDRSLPIDVTEWGVATDNGRALEDNFGFPVNMTYAQAGAQLKESVATLRRAAGGRLRSFIVYQVRDQQKTGASTSREAYFGALQHELQKKGAYTEAVQALMKE
ncbi:MAG TPA: hypothetical protein VH025_07865 [Solirubrobacteraceae bacterium]|nr:hypothetical protein [Solirubrobacteraceae bacterium]